jgi:hypothetical protein
VGLIIHSLGEAPAHAERGYCIYLLDYGWKEPLGEALRRNFKKMAAIASANNAVVAMGVHGIHFADEVLSWHSINGQPSRELLPAILITTRHPQTFRESRPDRGKDEGPIIDNRMLLIPLREVCTTSTDVAVLINKIFDDIEKKTELTNFVVAQEMIRGKRGAITDAIVLRPSVLGFGVDLKAVFGFLKGETVRRLRQRRLKRSATHSLDGSVANE